MRRDLGALPTTDAGPDRRPVTPVTGRVRRPSLRSRVAVRLRREPPSRHDLQTSSSRHGERRRTVLTVVVTAVVVVALATVSVGPAAPAVRRMLGLGPKGGADGHAYSFIRYDGHGNPVGFSPCDTVHYEVNHDDAPSDWHALVTDSFASLSAATGLRFVDDGSTHDDDYFARRTTSNGSGEPVLVGWSTSARVHELDGDVAGVTSSDYDPTSDHYVSGRVVLDADAFSALEGEPFGRPEERAIVMHELGHLVGLGHVDDPRELMYPTVGQRLTYGAGDRAGLRVLGHLTC